MKKKTKITIFIIIVVLMGISWGGKYIYDHTGWQYMNDFCGDNVTVGKIVILTGGGNQGEITDQETIQNMQSMMEQIPFKKSKPGKTMLGWSMWVQWYDTTENLLFSVGPKQQRYSIETADGDQGFYKCKDQDKMNELEHLLYPYATEQR